MRALLACLCCLGRAAVPAAASLLRASRSERHLAFRRVAAQEARAETQADPLKDTGLDKMELSIAAKPASEVPKPLSQYTPESMGNVAGYEIAQATPMPAAFNGEYCKGGACQFRVVPPPPLPPTPIPITPPPLPIGGNALSGREFCRGLSCLPGMGAPGDPKLQAFNLNCARLYNDIAGGMVGSDTSRTVPEVHQSFVNVCNLRVGPLEVGACPTYANTWVGAVAPKVNNPTCGTTMEICTDTYWFIQAFKTAEVDLKLTAAALPKVQSLLAISLNRLGTGGVGPSSPRGLKWREWVYKNKKWPSPPQDPRQLAENGGFSNAFMQTGSEDPEKKKPPIPGADSEEDTPRGLPKYTQNPPVGHVNTVPQKDSKYQIAPGSPDGAVGPVEISGDLFNYCANQFSEIMMGFAQTANEVVKLTKSWCTWQASVSSWVGQKDEFGHPDWNHRTCTNMQNFMGFCLKDLLADKTTGLSSQQVCKAVFLTIGAVHRTDGIVKDAWAMQSTRGAPEGVSGGGGGDDGMKDLLANAQAYADKIFAKLRGQKAAYEKLNNAKMDTSAFDADNVAQPPPDPAPDLPDSDDLDPTALLAVSVERVRQSTRVGVGAPHDMTPWGRTEQPEAATA